MNAAKHPAVNSDRLKSLLEGVNAFGRCAKTGGFYRQGFSDADMAARQWFVDRIAAEDGFRVWRDGAANVFGRLGPESGKIIMAGSHLDTVPDGGAFDGALGACVALECALAIRDAGLPLTHPIEIAGTAEEEGRFGGMLGSQAMAGSVSEDWLAAATDADGVRLWGAMEAQGLDPRRIRDAARNPGSIRAFLELHVEQGPVLERTGAPVAIVDRISGVESLAVSLQGVANHSGTTPMDMRADAFAGLAEIATAIPELIATRGSDESRITIGKVELTPNFPHTIPGGAEFSLIIRDTDPKIMDRMAAAMHAKTDEAAKRHGLSHHIERKSRLDPVALDAGLAALMAEEAKRLGLNYLTIPSGAGHDAQTMQLICPSGLIFVPSRGGVSHAPQEWTEWEDILVGARLMLAAMTRLACAA